MFCSWKAPSSLDFPNLHHVPSGDSQLHLCEKSLCFTDCKAEARSWATLRSHVAALSTASAFTCSSTWVQGLKWLRLSYSGMLSLPRWHPALRGMASEQGLWDCYCRRSLCFVFLFSLVMSLGQRLGSLWWDTSLQRRCWRTASDYSGVAEVLSCPPLPSSPSCCGCRLQSRDGPAALEPLPFVGPARYSKNVGSGFPSYIGRKLQQLKSCSSSALRLLFSVLDWAILGQGTGRCPRAAVAAPSQLKVSASTACFRTCSVCCCEAGQIPYLGECHLATWMKSWHFRSGHATSFSVVCQTRGFWTRDREVTSTHGDQYSWWPSGCWRLQKLHWIRLGKTPIGLFWEPDADALLPLPFRSVSENSHRARPASVPTWELCVCQAK